MASNDMYLTLGQSESGLRLRHSIIDVVYSGGTLHALTVGSNGNVGIGTTAPSNTVP